MDTVLGVLGLIAWIVVTISLAAGVTWAVVRLSPGDKPNRPKEASEQ